MDDKNSFKLIEFDTSNVGSKSQIHTHESRELFAQVYEYVNQRSVIGKKGERQCSYCYVNICLVWKSSVEMDFKFV